MACLEPTPSQSRRAQEIAELQATVAKLGQDLLVQKQIASAKAAHQAEMLKSAREARERKAAEETERLELEAHNRAMSAMKVQLATIKSQLSAGLSHGSVPPPLQTAHRPLPTQARGPLGSFPHYDPASSSISDDDNILTQGAAVSPPRRLKRRKFSETPPSQRAAASAASHFSAIAAGQSAATAQATQTAQEAAKRDERRRAKKEKARAGSTNLPVKKERHQNKSSTPRKGATRKAPPKNSPNRGRRPSGGAGRGRSSGRDRSYVKDRPSGGGSRGGDRRR